MSESTFKIGKEQCAKIVGDHNFHFIVIEVGLTSSNAPQKIQSMTVDFYDSRSFLQIVVNTDHGPQTHEYISAPTRTPLAEADQNGVNIHVLHYLILPGEPVSLASQVTVDQLSRAIKLVQEASVGSDGNPEEG